MSIIKNASQLKKIPFWLALVIILVLAIVLVVVVTILASVPEPTPPPRTNGNNGQTPPVTDNGLPKQIFSYIGEIQSKADNSFVIKAIATKNQLDKDTMITVKISAVTKYVSMSVPQTLPPNPSQATLQALFKSQDITYNDLKVGNEVTVVSQVDVFGKTEMDAARVQKTTVK